MAESHDEKKTVDKEATKNKPTKKRWARIRTCLKAPIKLLSTVRNMYVGSITNCAGQASSYGCGSSVNNRSVRSPTKSFSSVSLSSVNNDRGLARAASGRRPVGLIVEKRLGDGSSRESYLVTARKLQRSFTTGWFETIDEEKPCEFGEDVRVSTGSLYPRRKRMHCSNVVTPLPMHETSRLHMVRLSS